MQEVIGSTPIYSTKATVIWQLLFFEGVVAHLVEHLVRNQKVVGSSPIYSTGRESRRSPFLMLAKRAAFLEQELPLIDQELP